jgi:hypothetical protein
MTMSNNNQNDQDNGLNTVFCKVDAALDTLNGVHHFFSDNSDLSFDDKDYLYSLIVKADDALTKLHDRVRLVIDGRVSDPNDLE